ncbi:protein translocase subunit SecF [Woeseia oceani]|uniref:Protein-export membrane protein SecF n=1 Tax=Woeseia oceani TaxID=1548547 RepID=A0A193LE51_9GAMM|nr:protein translocase subunit SecF [Woeseia oceani]ANO50805.1 protein-export membrane protein SecF [Woeseia oceani]
MRLVKENTKIDFLSDTRRKVAVGFSVLLVLASLVSLATRGLDFGIDFTGGVLLEVGYPQDADLDRIRALITDAGFEEAQVQTFGATTDVMIRLPPQENENPNEIRETLRSVLSSDEPNVDLRRVDFVGPQVGQELTEQGGLAMIFTLLMIFAYIMFRFQWKFAAGAVAALAHDIIVTLGFFSFFHWPFDLTVVAAVLAVVGYSLNDTVVVFDRIRENFFRLRGTSAEEVMNISINETLARTVITGLTTLVVLAALLFLGGESVGPFSLALIVGILVGTYSSIYMASATALMLEVTAVDLMPPQDDGGELVDDLP